jgi:hypothetical protein
MIEICFNCGEEIDDENDIYYILAGRCGSINFCEVCGKDFNIPNKCNTIHKYSDEVYNYKFNINN